MAEITIEVPEALAERLSSPDSSNPKNIHGEEQSQATRGEGARKRECGE